MSRNNSSSEEDQVNDSNGQSDDLVIELTEQARAYYEAEGVKNPVGAAMKKAGEMLGISSSTIAKRLHEERKRNKRNPPIITFGLPVSTGFKKDMKLIQSYMKEFRNRMRYGKTILTKLKNTGVALPPQLEQLHRKLDEIKELERLVTPDALCPYCKCVAPYFKDCTACDGLGWVGAAVVESAPRELLSSEEPHICVDGKIIDIEVEEDDDICQL